MNEAPPVPVSDSFNISQWNATDTGKSATQSWVNRNFLSKVIIDSASKLISFASGITTNSISVYSGNTISIGTTIGGQTVALYSPTTNVPVLSSTDNSIKIPNTSWVNSWFGNIVNNMSLIWALAQTFTLGIVTNSIKCITTSGTLNINSVDSGTGGVIICGGPTQTSGVTIGNNNGITSNKIDIGSQTKTLSLTGSTIDLATALRPFYSYPIGVDKIGEIKTGTYAPSPPVQNFITSIPLVYSTITLTTAGVYQFFFQGGFNAVDNTTNIPSARFMIVTTSFTKRGQISTNFGALSTTFDYTNSCSSTVYHTGTETYQAIVQLYFINTAPVTTPNSFVFTATRIA